MYIYLFVFCFFILLQLFTYLIYSQIRASNAELITDPNLVLENVTKFARIAKELK